MNKDRLNDPHAIKLLSRRAHELSSSFDEVKLMHVCGTHEIGRAHV